MAHIYLTNSLNSSKVVKLDVSFVRYYDINSRTGDPVWLLEVATTHTSASGTSIPPYYINNVSEDDENLDDLMAKAVSFIGKQIDWSPLSLDKEEPYVLTALPSYAAGTTVSIASNIEIKVKDAMPSSGLDLSDIKVTLNNGVQDFDITDECSVEGDPFTYRVEWKPTFREYKYYE